MELLESKMRMPREETVLFRPRVNRLVGQAAKKKLVVLEAGPGFGKTTAMAAWLRRQPHGMTWLTLSVLERDCLRLVQYLIRGIREQYPATRDRLSGEPPSTGGYPLFSHAASMLAQIPEDHTIVLDDWQHVGPASQAVALADFLLENTPSRIRFLVASRTRTSLGVSRLVTQGRAALITEQDLAFTRDEAWYFFRALPPEKDKLERIQEAVFRTGGWPAGLDLLSRSGDTRDLCLRGSDPVYFRYLEEIVFAPLEKDIREFLVDTAILPHLSPGLCNRFLKREDSLAVLRHLEACHLFVSLLDAERHVYVFHPLFREFLQLRFKTDKTGPAGEVLHRRAARLLKDAGQWEKAVSHYREIGDLEKIRDLLERFGLKAVQKGHSDMMTAFYRLLPDDSAWILFQKSFIREFDGRITEARLLNEKALTRFRQAGDRYGIQYCRFKQACFLFQSGDMIQCRQLLEPLLAETPEARHLKLDILLMLAFIYSYGADHRRSRFYLEAAEEAMKEPAADTEGYHPKLRFHRLLFLQHLGEFSRALAYSRADQANPRARLAICQQTAWSFFHMGRFEEGLKSGRAGLDLLAENRFEDAFMAFWSRIGIAVNLSGMGRTDESREMVNACTQFFETAGFNWGLGFTGLISGMNALRTGQYARARQCVNQALDRIRGMGLVLVEIYLRFHRIKADLLANDLASAEQGLDRIPSFSASSYLLMAAHLHAVRAVIAVRHNRVGDAVTAVSELVRICRDQQYGMADILPGELFADLADSPDPRLSASEPFRTLADWYRQEEAARTGLEIRFLGKFSVTTRQGRIPDKRWNNQKARILFQYLVLNRAGGFVKKERLMELLWPDEDPAKSAKRFHVTLAALRKILQPDIPKGRASSYIISSKDAYTIDPGKNAPGEKAPGKNAPGETAPGENCRIDTEAFNGVARDLENEKDPVRIEILLREGIRLYKGDFLAEDPFLPEWEGRRRRYADRYLALLKAGALFYDARQDYETGVRYAGRYLDRDPYDEPMVRRLMRFYGLLGRKNRVKSVFQECRDRMESDLDCSVEPETESLYRQLMAGRVLP